MRSLKNDIVIDILQACFKNDAESQQNLSRQIFAMFTDISGMVLRAMEKYNLNSHILTCY